MNHPVFTCAHALTHTHIRTHAHPKVGHLVAGAAHQEIVQRAHLLQRHRVGEAVHRTDGLTDERRRRCGTVMPLRAETLLWLRWWSDDDGRPQSVGEDVVDGGDGSAHGAPRIAQQSDGDMLEGVDRGHSGSGFDDVYVAIGKCSE